ncbi:MAG: hypothetical protein O3C31_04940 [Bacteroidetes bacterium]|nr:hypothetical protein [Flavobacteriaceae bacterium]MBL6677902.1 hypothetical protein [Flavobacteriaceae bacterium]MDA0331393.1 hypothetical protein [Bacteroidota bacterium]MDA0885846.1 hypothetical protein [Bacteroidota bacterium]MDA1226172.1 hypothetical protein [Bacteroidota bacterium]
MAKSIASKDSTSINKIWELCGFRSKLEFERNFTRIHGISFKEYVDNL